MQRKNTPFETVLRIASIALMFVGLMLLTLPFPYHVKQYQEEAFSLGLFIMALNFISKFVRFYKQANKIIVAIWVVSIMLLLLGSAMYYAHWGWFGIVGWGIVAFNFTLRYSFFDNRPEII